MTGTHHRLRGRFFYLPQMDRHVAGLEQSCAWQPEGRAASGMRCGRRSLRRLATWVMVWLISGPASWLMLVDLAARTAQAQSGPATTQVTDKVYRADGTPAQGVLLISWGGFTTASGTPVAAGNTSVTLGADGALSVNLVANAGATPANSYYVVVYQLQDSTVRTEYWLVPSKSSAVLADVRVTPGTGNPTQMISKQYVDNAVAAKASDQSVVHLSGLETIAGTKQFATPPSVPAPVSATDAANKGYVDQAVAAVGAGSYVAKTGDTMTGPLSLPSDPVSSNHAATKHYVDTGTAGKASLIGGVVPTSQLGSGTANSTMCLKGDSSWGACGTSANAVSIQNVAVDPAQPSDGQVLTYEATSSTYKPKAGGSGNATALQGTPLDVTPPIDGQVVTFDAAAGKYKPKSGGGALSSAMQSVRYAADFAWTRTASTDLSAPGAKTVSLASCPLGTKGSEKYYYVYVSGTGTAETVLVTGGTCSGDGVAGTLQFTTANAHGAGYTVSSATGGIQEASIAARQTNIGGNNYNYAGGGRVHVTGQVQVYAPVTFMTPNQVIDFSGSSIVCNMDADCLVVGDPRDHISVGDVTLMNPRGEPTIVHGTHSFISVYGQKTRIFNVMPLPGKIGTGIGVFGSLVSVYGDQAFLLDGLDTSSGYGIECNSTQCGTYIVAPGPFGGNPDNAAVGWLKNLNLNIQCTGNGIDWQSGNTLHVEDSVIQGYSQFGIRGGTQRGGYGMIQLDNIYMEDGANCPNPLGNLGAAGIIAQGGKVDIRGGEGPVGHFPQFANTGSTNQYDYYVVAHHTINGATNPLYVGYALSNGSGNITVTTPDIGDAATFDLLRTSRTATAAQQPAPVGTGNFAVVTGVTRASACANGVCTFTDTQAALASYTVPVIGYYPFVSYWPGALALFSNGDSGSALSASTANLNLNRILAAVYQANVLGYQGAATESLNCNVFMGSPIWQNCLGGGYAPNTDTTQHATVLVTKPNSGGQVTNAKGRLNLGTSGTGPSHIITLDDSNFAKTIATTHSRPSNDANDAYIGMDTASGLQWLGLSIGAPTSISHYIANVGDGTNFKERLTASAKTFNVPVTINGNLTVTGTCTGCGGGGAGFSWRGVWSGTTAYNVSDAVSLNGSSYIALQANTNQQPPNATYWGVLSQAGGAGPAGQGVPAGGAANQVLAKVDGTNYNTQWVNAPSAESDAFTPTTGTKTINGNLSVSGTIASTGSGPWNMVGSFGTLTAAPAGKSMIGFDPTGQLAVSENGGAVTEVAKDPAVVHLANAETIAGAKTFAAPVTVNSGSAFLVEGTRQGATSVTLDAGYDFGLYLRSDNLLGCQLSTAYGGGSCFPTAAVTSVAGRTGAVTLTEADVASLTADLGAKVPTSTTVNGHALSGNVTVAPSDLAAGALANGMTATTQSAGDNSTKVATTAFVAAAVTAASPSIAGFQTEPNTTGSMTLNQNKTNLTAYYLTGNLTTSGLWFYISGTADNTGNLYDIGIYNSAGTLLTHLGATAGTTFAPAANAWKRLTWTGGPVTIPAGKIYVAVTTNAATPASVGGWSSVAVYSSNSSFSSSGGALASSITPPSDAAILTVLPTFILN